MFQLHPTVRLQKIIPYRLPLLLGLFDLCRFYLCVPVKALLQDSGVLTLNDDSARFTVAVVKDFRRNKSTVISNAPFDGLFSLESRVRHRRVKVLVDALAGPGFISFFVGVGAPLHTVIGAGAPSMNIVH